MCYTIFLRDTRSCIDSHIRRMIYPTGTQGVYLRHLRSNIEAVMGLSTWHMCSSIAQCQWRGDWTPVCSEGLTASPRTPQMAHMDRMIIVHVWGMRE